MGQENGQLYRKGSIQLETKSFIKERKKEPTSTVLDCEYTAVVEDVDT